MCENLTIFTKRKHSRYKLMMTLFFCCCMANVSIGQFNTSNFYPALKPIQLPPNYASFNKDTVGCISGNCQDGEGVFINIKGWWRSGLMHEEIKLDMIVFKGKFSDSGSRFTGKIYKINTPLKKQGEAKTGLVLMPEKAMPDFTTDTNTDEYLVAEGEALEHRAGFKKVVVEYILHGKATDHYITRAKKDSVISAEGFYSFGNAYWEKIRFHPSTGKKSYEGFTRFNGEPLAGKMVYTDGSVYEGSFTLREPYGAGVLTKGTTKKSGTWVLGELIEAFPVTLPQTGFIVPAETAPQVTYFLKGVSQTGSLLGQSAPGKPVWVWTTYTLFYGTLVDGKANEYALLQTVAKDETRENKHYWFNWLEYFYEGKFEEGVQLTGSSGIGDYGIRHTLTNCIRPNLQDYELRSGSVFEGQFVNDQLNGCATTHSVAPARSTIINYFEEGRIKGWYIMVDTTGKVKNVSYSTPAVNGVLPFTEKEELSEADISWVTAQKSPCVNIPDSALQAYAIVLRNRIKHNEEMAIFKAKNKQREEERKKLSASLAPCAYGNDMLKRYGGRISSAGNQEQMLVDYDCNQKKFMLAKRNKTGPKPEIVNVAYEWVFSIDTTAAFSSERYGFCGACNGEGKQSRLISTTKDTWKPVLGLVVYQRVYRTTTHTQHQICNICQGKAWIRR